MAISSAVRAYWTGGMVTGGLPRASAARATTRRSNVRGAGHPSDMEWMLSDRRGLGSLEGASVRGEPTSHLASTYFIRPVGPQRIRSYRGNAGPRTRHPQPPSVVWCFSADPRDRSAG